MKLLIAGFGLLVVLSLVLLRGLMGSAEPAGKAPRTTESPSGARGDAVSDPKDPRDPKGSQSGDTPAPGGGAKSARKRPAIVESFASKAGGPDDELDFDETGLVIPIIDKPTIGIANATTSEKLRECLQKHSVGLSGTAVLTFIVSKKREKDDVVIAAEHSGYEEEGSTITDPTLVECMHKTAFDMQFQPPKNKKGVPVWGKRRIVVENGVLTENSIIDIGRIRP